MYLYLCVYSHTYIKMYTNIYPNIHNLYLYIVLVASCITSLTSCSKKDPNTSKKIYILDKRPIQILGGQGQIP